MDTKNIVNNGGPLVSIRDASVVLGVEYSILLRLVQRGEIPTVKLGDEYRLHPAVIKRIRLAALFNRQPVLDELARLMQLKEETVARFAAAESYANAYVELQACILRGIEALEGDGTFEMAMRAFNEIITRIDKRYGLFPRDECSIESQPNDKQKVDRLVERTVN